MTGIVGSVGSETSIAGMAEPIDREAWYETVRSEAGDIGLGLVHHDEKDPNGHAYWEDGRRSGVLHGTLTDRGSFSDEAAFFEALLANPSATLATVDGPFAVACVDRAADRVVVATDKLATRPCYHTAGASSSDPDLLFGSELKSILTGLERPTVDEQALHDMVLMGHLWGKRTLIEEVKALPPATVLDYADGAFDLERYWKPDYTPASTEGYTQELAERYRDMLTDTAATIEGTVGLWLSGGLDSRAIATELRRNAETLADLEMVRTYTYDLNPKGGGNPQLARRVADRLGLPIEEVEQTPDEFVDVLREVVRLTDGMLNWLTMITLAATFNLDADHPDLFFEGAGQGEFIGNHPYRYHLTNFDSAAESIYHSERKTTVEDAQRILDVDADPKRAFVDAEARSDEPTVERRAVDAHYESYYSRYTFASNKVMQSQGGTRVPFPHTEFLEHVSRLPLDYRMHTFPFTRGGIPYGTIPPKLGLIMALDPEMGDIPYERTGVAPKYPLGLHVAGFVGKTALGRLRSERTYGAGMPPDDWYRGHPRFRQVLDELLDEACERPYFDADDIRRRQREHLSGEANHISGVLSTVSTLEVWFEEFID